MSSIPISLEFFPPRSEAVERRMHEAAVALQALDPGFFTVTYGADGSSRRETADTVEALRARTGVESTPHISCIGTPEEELRALLDGYTESGVTRVVAIRGDMPRDGVISGPFRHGTDLVRFIREAYGDRFHITVAAYPERHPEAPDLETDLNHFRDKIEAGADAAITQYFYNIDAYTHFMESCAAKGIHVPLIAGIMPMHDLGQLQRFSARCGAEIPRWFASRLEGFRDDESRRAFAADFVAELCRRLHAAGAPGFHFYTLNRAQPTMAVCERLGDIITPAGQPEGAAA